jgi:uncharacterized heparinase superfamily protein
VAEIISRIRRGLRKPPRVIAARIWQEFRAEADRFISPWRAKRLNSARLLQDLGFASMAECWRALAAKPFVSSVVGDAGQYAQVCPADQARILQDAECALAHQVDLLGSGLVSLGQTIDWHKDYKTGFDWPPAYFRGIEYSNLERPSDVKFPWEVSRLQWLMPAGQAYLLTKDERYALGVREVLEQWMGANPYAHSVNWACTMEVALRILTWSWFFHVFHNSQAWADEAFRTRFLRMLYLHGDFTARNLEKSDVNGNHYTADASGLVFAGLFFGERGWAAAHWHALGWQILNEEMAKQVFPDGVDYEASVPYHRLVLELFLFPALYRIKRGMEIPVAYRDRLLAMARFTAAYSRADGSVPLWGDADDARALPFGGQLINDHRYLLALVGTVFDNTQLLSFFSGDVAEVFWCLGERAAHSLTQRKIATQQPLSQAFPDGGFYIMRHESDHVFIDCGPIGLAGRGGHGHNDALSFEAALCGVHLVTDSGAYIYTADYKARNRFRSTGSHNTPNVDGEEINRFIRPDYLWNLHDDAKPELIEWQVSDVCDRFRGQHSGYDRLHSPVRPIRTIELHHAEHRLLIQDEFTGEGAHDFAVPLHLAVGIDVRATGQNRFLLSRLGQSFALSWGGSTGWKARIEESDCSPSYGCLNKSKKIIWRCHGHAAEVKLKVLIEPETKELL